MTKKIERLTEEINRNPSAELFYQRGMSYYLTEEYDLAIKDFEEGLKLDEKHANCFTMRISAMSRLERYDEALAECDKSIALDPGFAPAYAGRGGIYGDQGDYKEALEEYAKAIEIDPNWADSYNDCGNICFYQGRYDEAYACYSKAIELNASDAVIYYGRGDVLVCQNRLEDAILDYTKAIECNWDWADPYSERGDIYYTQKRYEKALADYQKAYALYSDNEGYYKSLAKNRIDELTALLESQEAQKDDARKIIDATNIFRVEIDKNKKNQSDFFNHKYEIKGIDNLEFTVLRKWNSYTPIVGSGFRASKGGGYFMKSGTTGIVIDPGFNFIEHFIAGGHKFKEIDAVLITHAHNDHTSDLDALLTILHKYNDDLFGSYSEYKDGSIVDDVLQGLKYSRDDIKRDPAKMKEAEEKVNKKFEGKRKIITFYITTGVFKKYVSFFSLMKSSNYKLVCIDDEQFNTFNIDKVKVRVIKAKHYDIMSDATAVGFCFEHNGFALVYTGDTGFWGMEESFTALKTCLGEKRIALVANLGGFKESEDSYSKDKNNEKCYYPNHLGRLGVAKLVEIIKPEVCMISEFGEEFNGYRIKIAEVFNQVYRDSLQTVFLPADVGLCVNSDMKILAITEAAPKTSFDERKDKDGFPREFIQPEDVRVDEIDQISELFYYSRHVDDKALAKRKVAKFYESLR